MIRIPASRKRVFLPMKILLKSALLAAMVLSAPSMAQSSCSPKGLDVCKMARQIADEMAGMLPVRLNQNLSIQTVFAERHSVTLTAKFEYDKATLDRVLADAGLSNDQMLDVMRKNAKGAVCATNAPAKPFIENGGLIRYLYRFNDGSTYTTVLVASCA